jgi:hypothetical protein
MVETRVPVRVMAGSAEAAVVMKVVVSASNLQMAPKCRSS